MDFRLLEFFLRVSELGSINKAATHLHLSQPALSRHVATLEHEMGTKLFTRTQGGVQLTEAGVLLAERARPLMKQFTILKEQVGERAAGQLAIGIPPSWQNLFTSPFVEQFTGSHPHVALRVYEGVSNVLREYIFGRLLDIAIVPFDTSPAAGYRQTPLIREPMVLVGRAQDKLHSSAPVNLSRLDGRRLVLPGRPNVARVHIERALERNGMEFKLALETDTLALNLDLARRGVGLTVVPACALYGHGLGESISWAPIKGQYVTWVLCENLDRMHSHAVREGHKLVLRIVADALQQKTWLGAEDVKGAVGKATTDLAKA